MSAQTSVFKFNILVVDDDKTSLNVISSMLRTWKYDVVSANCPLDGLAISRVREFDLIVSDLHMPKMDGLQLQKEIEVESKLPVIIMSSNDDEGIILKSLSTGAVFFISKPVNPMDFKNIWQYAVASRRDRSMRHIEKIGSIQAAGTLVIGRTSNNGDNNSASSVNEGKRSGNRKDGRRKSNKKNKQPVDGDKSIGPKKAKVIWDNDLHNRFLQAIKHITLEKAVPKKILEFMNIPGLTRENVASHLQKYRIFLKKVAEKGFDATSKNSMTLDRTFRSSFAAGHTSLLFQRSQDAYSPFKGLEKQKGACQSFNSTNFGSMGGLSSSNSGLRSSLSPFRYGQSCLLGGGTQANVQKPYLDNTYPLYQPSRTGLGSNDIGTNMFPRGGAISGTNSMQIPNLYNDISTPLLETSGIWNPCYGAPGNNNMESTATGNDSFSNLNYSSNNNYAGIQINNDENLIAVGGQMGLNGTNDGLNGGASFGLINNGAQIPGLGAAAVEDSTFGTCLAPGESSSAGLSHGNYQFPTSFSGVNFEEGGTSALAQQQFVLGNDEQNDFVSDLLNNNNNVASDFHNLSETQQFDEFTSLMMDSTDFQPTYHQQQGGEEIPNPNFGSNLSLPAETNAPSSQPLDDVDFPSPLNVDDSHAWDEPTLQQLLEIQELLNPDLEENIVDISVDYHPVVDNNTNQQQGANDFANSELNDLFLAENPDGGDHGNQDWDDDFINSLLGDIVR